MKCSLNFKIRLLALALLSILVLLIFKAIAVRQRRIIWLEDLSRQMVPLVLEDRAVTPRPTVSPSHEGTSEPEATPTAPALSTGKGGRHRGEIERERARLERMLDNLPAAGPTGRSSFMRRAREMELCWQKLDSSEPALRREGELRCYRLAKGMVDDRGPGGGAAMETMDRYMAVFMDEVHEICLRQRFPASRERSRFSRWAAAAMEKAETPVLTFLIRLLGIVGDQDAAKALRPYCLSRDPVVRTTAVWAMGMQGSPEVIDEIGKILADRSLPAEEGEVFLAALERIGGRSAAGVLLEVVRSGRPLLAYEAYLSLGEMRGQTGRVLSLEEFEQGRTVLCEEYRAWQKAQDAQSEGGIKKNAFHPPIP
ncbi:MAG: HEAT repeat domain-containing protein [Candidatus Aureabacteria bacterium]|nr:HEAT repeat domain-containing protein [Candidatus Auribacterota bacterium]